MANTTGDIQRVGADWQAVEVWWYLPSAAGGVALWVHNPSDDFSATAGRGIITAKHDFERYGVEGVSRVSVVAVDSDLAGYVRSGTGGGWFLNCELISYG